MSPSRWPYTAARGSDGAEGWPSQAVLLCICGQTPSGMGWISGGALEGLQLYVHHLRGLCQLSLGALQALQEASAGIAHPTGNLDALVDLLRKEVE